MKQETSKSNNKIEQFQQHPIVKCMLILCLFSKSRENINAFISQLTMHIQRMESTHMALSVTF